ncbi:hypothetical protein [Vibrio maritimus]|uniref:hypothetical protein n=1 Tax=Vibrio maritimus TaxID=990268 RepID=UPI001F366AD4|nr:hypothetical protein [Vibrio maritimus]
MANVGYCRIDNLKLSRESIEAVDEIRDIVDRANMLAVATSTVPLFDLFLGKANTSQTMLSIAGYDWVEFSKTLNAINKTAKGRVFSIAETMSLRTGSYTAEGEFWRCVSNAAL